MAKVFDIVIFGASGFTGKYVVKEALMFLSPDSPIKTIALAGQNASKLVETLKWASKSHHNIPLLVADTSDQLSLRRMASQAKLVLNCFGPFRFHGEPVVSACVEAGCDYLDICGEPEFMERMEDVYHEKAVEMGSLVVSACGFDSIPAELGFMFNSMQSIEPSVPNRVETYLSLESDKKIVGNFVTFESAILGVVNVNKLIKLRQSRRRGARPLIPGYAPTTNGSTIVYQKKLELYGVKLPSADATVVRRILLCHTDNSTGLQGVNENPKQAAFWSKIKPAHFGIKISTKNPVDILRIIVIEQVFGLLSRFPSVISLGVFGKNGPTEDEIVSARFKMWFVSHGLISDKNRVSEEPDVEIITRIMGPEIGYVTTPIILIQCAMVVLKQRQDLPKGGVFPPGIVFELTDLRDRLQENGISFDVIFTE